MKRHFFRSIDEMFEQLDLSSDFYQFAPSDRDDRFMISCYISQVDKEKLHRYLLLCIPPISTDWLGAE